MEKGKEVERVTEGKEAVQRQKEEARQRERVEYSKNGVLSRKNVSVWQLMLDLSHRHH